MNPSAATKIVAAIVAAIVIVIGVLWWATVHEPSYDVTVSSTSGTISVSWSGCGSKRPGNVYGILIIPADGDRSLSCRLRPVGQSQHWTPLPGRWFYGSVPAGYVLDGTCPALDHNRKLRARVGGRIGGEVVFRLGAGGSIDIDETSCNWLDRLL